MDKSRIHGLSGTSLKLLALIIMTIDHIGMILFPSVRILRIIGRAAFPIFAYMIAEGCRYTRNKGKYTARLALFGLVCQVAYYLVADSIYMCIFVTFTMSAVVIFALDRCRSDKYSTPLFAAAVAASAIVTLLLPQLITGFGVDYGFAGVMLPVLIYIGRNRLEQLALCALGIAAVSLELGGIQWWSFTALLPLACYNGSRGKYPMKNLFYLYYPTHLAVLYGVSQVI